MYLFFIRGKNLSKLSIVPFQMPSVGKKWNKSLKNWKNDKAGFLKKIIQSCGFSSVFLSVFNHVEEAYNPICLYEYE